MNDHISNFIIKIKNASVQGHESIAFPESKMILAVAEALAKNGWVKDVKKKSEKVKNHTRQVLDVTLQYNEDSSPKVTGVERVSKSSKRVYAGYKDLRPIRNGYGITILTTPAGIMSDLDARKQKVGGEPLFKMW